MRTFRAVYLHLLSPLHVGEQGVGVERMQSLVVHSDTLWGALVWGWSRLYGDPSPLVSLEPGWSPPLQLSSAFPFVEAEGGGRRLFLPRPLGPLAPALSPSLSLHKRKEVKGMGLLVQPAFERWVNGEPLTDRELEEALGAWRDLRSRVREYAEPHVRLGHASFASQLYWLGATVYSEGTGLYFLAEVEDPELWKRLCGVLDLLAEEGLGGRRARGLGLFRWESAEVSLRVPTEEEAGRWLLLSVLNPEPQLVSELTQARYRLYEARGWSLSPCGEQGFRKPVWMILEGAVFPKRPRGRVVEVTPEREWSAPHPVFRHGVAFCLPLKEAEGCLSEGSTC